MMKNISILMAFLILNGATEFHQFLKLPLLITHLREHRSTDPDMTLVEFLELHYTYGTHPNDQDEEEDQELPFRSISSLNHLDVLYLLRKDWLIQTPVFPYLKCICAHPEGLPASYSQFIFHPPRNC